MDPDKQREIASRGGKAAHAAGAAHEFTPEEARQAGRRGGKKISADRAHMAEIGRVGGKTRGAVPSTETADIAPEVDEAS